MPDHANNLNNPNNGNEVNNIPSPFTMEGLNHIICQLQDQNSKLTAKIEVMNWENATRENKASSHQNNGNVTHDGEENNTRHT